MKSIIIWATRLLGALVLGYLTTFTLGSFHINESCIQIGCSYSTGFPFIQEHVDIDAIAVTQYGFYENLTVYFIVWLISLWVILKFFSRKV